MGVPQGQGCDESTDAPPPPPFWSTIYGFVRPYRGSLLVSGVCAGIVGISNALKPLFIKWLIDDGVLRKGGSGELLPMRERAIAVGIIVGLYVLMVSLRLAFGVYGYRFLVRGVERFLCDLRSRFFRHVQRLCFRFHDQISSGELFNYIMGSPVQSLKMFLHQGALMIPIQVVSWVVAVGALIAFNWAMAMITGVTVVLVVLVNHRSRRIVRKMSGAFMETESDVSKYVADMLRGCRAIKIYAMEDNVSYSFEDQISRIREKSVRLGYRRQLEHVKAEGVQYIGMTAVFLSGAWFCLYRDMPVGTFAAFVASINVLMQPLMALMELNLIRANAEAGLERIVRILDRDISTPEASLEAQTELQVQAELARAEGLPCVEVEGLTFEYEAGRPVLRDVSCRIANGQSVALVGPSGSGKTTFISMLLRLYDPSAGVIRLNGAELNSYSLQELRAAFGVVPQDPYIFQATIRDNIRVTRPAASDERLGKAMDVAYVTEFVEEMPDGLSTSVGEGGSNLSGGQRQRLAIARAVLAEPDYFIFDEATSALDNKSEKRVQAAMDTLMAGRTSFVIAHRLTTIRNVDRVLVFEDGRIVQDGSYEELAATDGLFRDMLTSAAFTATP